VAEAVSVEGRAKYNAQSVKGDRDIYKGLTFWPPNVNLRKVLASGPFFRIAYFFAEKNSSKIFSARY